MYLFLTCLLGLISPQSIDRSVGRQRERMKEKVCDKFGMVVGWVETTMRERASPAAIVGFFYSSFYSQRRVLHALGLKFMTR